MTEPRLLLKANSAWTLLGLGVCLLLMSGCGSAQTSAAHDASVAEDPSEVEEAPPAQPDKSTATTNAAKSTAQAAIDAVKPPLGQITVLVPSKKFKKEGPKKALRLNFDDIDIELVLNTKKLTVDLPKSMPDWLKNLNGQRVRLRGYMRPDSVYTTEGIKRFIFCRDTSACCFGPDPTMYYLIETTMRSGTSTEYRDKIAFDVEGTFRIEPIVQEKSGIMAQFYHLDDCQIVKR